MQNEIDLIMKSLYEEARLMRDGMVQRRENYYGRQLYSSGSVAGCGIKYA